jgi:hypothetical protein
MVQCVMAQLLTWNVVKSQGVALLERYTHNPSEHFSWKLSMIRVPLSVHEYFSGVIKADMWDEGGRMVKNKFEERENMINPKIMAQLETVNQLQYFKYDETGLLEERDHRGNSYSAKDFLIKINMWTVVVQLCLVFFSRFCWTRSTEVLQVRSTSTSVSSKEWSLVVRGKLTLRKIGIRMLICEC